jgi:hypothetical protein
LSSTEWANYSAQKIIPACVNHEMLSVIRPFAYDYFLIYTSDKVRNNRIENISIATEELDNLYFSPNVISVMKSTKMMWTVYVERMEALKMGTKV